MQKLTYTAFARPETEICYVVYYKTGNDNNLYITVSKDAKPEMYRPMQEAEQPVINAINVGLAAMHRAPEEELKESVLGFIYTAHR